LKETNEGGKERNGMGKKWLANKEGEPKEQNEHAKGRGQVRKASSVASARRPIYVPYLKLRLGEAEVTSIPETRTKKGLFLSEFRTLDLMIPSWVKFSDWKERNR
jgi:hypothetical protein